MVLAWCLGKGRGNVSYDIAHENDKSSLYNKVKEKRPNKQIQAVRCNSHRKIPDIRTLTRRLASSISLSVIACLSSSSGIS